MCGDLLCLGELVSHFLGKGRDWAIEPSARFGILPVLQLFVRRPYSSDPVFDVPQRCVLT